MSLSDASSAEFVLSMMIWLKLLMAEAQRFDLGSKVYDLRRTHNVLMCYVCGGYVLGFRFILIAAAVVKHLILSIILEDVGNGQS